jgi:hypothetical protein
MKLPPKVGQPAGHASHQEQTCSEKLGWGRRGLDG